MCLHLCTASSLTAGWFSETFWLSDHHIRQTSDSESGMFPCICSIHTEVSLPGWKYLIKICFYSPGQSERLRKATGTGLWKDGGQFGQWHDQVSELMGKFHKVLLILMVHSQTVFFRRYIAFDFHKECSRMRWHRLQILVDMVAEMQDEFGYVVFAC